MNIHEKTLKIARNLIKKDPSLTDWVISKFPELKESEDEELVQAKKEAYNDALDKIEYHSGEPTFDDGWSAAIWYLKKRNAKLQFTWEPSDEQMLVFKQVYDWYNNNFAASETLTSLYQDLKKLREE